MSALREITDAEGQIWSVFEVCPDNQRCADVHRAQHDAGCWLCFRTTSAVLRVMPIPEGWEKLSDAALLRLADIAGRQKEDDRQASLIPRHGTKELTYADTQAVTWRVTEWDTRNTPGSKGAHCLIFDSVDIVRRVWAYPANWFTLSASALIALT